MRILIDGIEYEPEAKEVKAVAIDMWYDRSRRNWVIYPVDAEGNQMAEAVYGFGKAEANKIKKELEQEYGLRKKAKKAKIELYDIRIIKGCCKGKICRSQKVVEDGIVFYICNPCGTKLDFTEDYVEVINKVK